jgi:hypothetical protein
VHVLLWVLFQTSDSLSGLGGSDFTLTDKGVDTSDTATNSAQFAMGVELTGGATKAEVECLLL